MPFLTGNSRFLSSVTRASESTSETAAPSRLRSSPAPIAALTRFKRSRPRQGERLMAQRAAQNRQEFFIHNTVPNGARPNMGMKR